jgi:uncharacterized protein
LDELKVARAFFLALLVSSVCAFTASAEVSIPPLTGRVVDVTGTLSGNDIASLTQTLKDLEQRKGSQIAVLIVPTTQPETIEQYSIRVADAWKIGRRKIDDGALIVVAKNDHRLRIEVGYGLEGSLTDVTARRIIDEGSTPKFRNGDFAGGISAGLARIITVIDGEPLPRPAPEATLGRDLDSFLNPFDPFVLFGIYIISVVCRSLFGRLVGSVAAGGVVGALAWYLLGSIALSLVLGGIVTALVFVADSIIGANRDAVRRSSRAAGGGLVVGPWVGGFRPGPGGGWSGGGGLGGGFSGGGGGFGGGGASGRW